MPKFERSEQLEDRKWGILSEMDKYELIRAKTDLLCDEQESRQTRCGGMLARNMQKKPELFQGDSAFLFICLNPFSDWPSASSS